MKSKLFTHGIQWPDEEYRKRFQVFLSLSDDDVTLMARELPSMTLARFREDAESLISEVITRMTTPIEKLDEAIGWALDTINRLIQNPEDKASSIVDDFTELKLLRDKKDKEKLEAFLEEAIKSIHDDVLPTSRRITALRRGAPILSSVEVVPDIRPTTYPIYEPSMPLEDFAPICDEFVTTFLLTLVVSGAPIPSVTVQLDEKQIEDVIKMLEAAKQEAEAVRLALIPQSDKNE